MMQIEEYAKISALPKKVLLYLLRERVIDDPLSQKDICNLNFLERIWGKRELLRAQLSRLSMKARLNFLRTAHLPSKWERYAASRYFNLPQGQSLKMSTLIEEIQTTYCFELKKKHIQKLYDIRNRIQVAKHRQNQNRIR